jgi:hypothetical protein
MRVSWLSLIVVAVAILWPWGATASAADQSEYIILNEGREWLMDMNLFGADGKLVGTNVAHRKLEALVERDGKQYFREHTWAEATPGPGELTRFVRKDDTGFYSINPQKNGESAKEEREIVLPLKAGESWERGRPDARIKESVVGLEDVTVGSQVYKECYHIHSERTDSGMVEDYWEAPQLGCVKSEIRMKNGAKLILTLKELKKGQ